LDDPNDAIPVAFDFVGMVKDEDKRGGVFDVDEYQDSKRAKLGDDDANDGNGEVKRSKRSRKETLKQKEEKRDFGECDRCRKHGQECDKQRVCAYCEIGGVVCERLPDKKPPKIIQTSVKKKIEIPTMDVLAPAPGEEAPRCENCRRGHRCACRVFFFFLVFL
jgi:hypothetical protein